MSATRNLGEEDYRFPALKCRLKSYQEFKYAPRGRALELEGVFVYKSAYPKRNPVSYQGYLDMSEEYRILGLRAPEKNALKIKCSIPQELASRDRLMGKPNIRVRGKVWMKKASGFDPMLKNKYFFAEELEFLPIEYKAVGTPAFMDFDDMFACIYSRGAEFHEYGPMLLLASLIGSEKRSFYFPEENTGCGLNVGFSSSDLAGGVSSGRIGPKMQKRLQDFVRKANIGPVNKITNQVRWNRFLKAEDPGILSRNLLTENEIDWNLISDIETLGRSANTSFITSDMNLVFDPALFPKKLSRIELRDLRQTILFSKSTPQLSYSEQVTAWIENKTDSVVRDLAKRVEYAPFLFRYRFEPLCDAYIKGSNLEDYLISGQIRIRKKDINSFFRIAEDAACDFAEYAKDHLKDNSFASILDCINDRRVQDLYRELIVKGGLSREDMSDYLTDRYAVSEKKAESLICSLLDAEPALVLKAGDLYKAVP